MSLSSYNFFVLMDFFVGERRSAYLDGTKPGKTRVSTSQLEGNALFSSLCLIDVPLWMQIHDLSVRRLASEVGTLIGNTVGHVVHVVDLEEDHGDGNWLRVKIMHSSEQPLCKGWRISFDENSKSCISFKYKQLPNLCYWNG